MIAIETLVIFSMASIVLALVPGPDNIFVLTQSALHGRNAGFLITLGLCTGLLVHTSIVALGVATIFQTSTLAIIVLKSVGAAYLLYLAWQAFRAEETSLNATENQRMSWRQLYARGVIMSITNPKLVIFFLAFLPQFVEQSRGSATIQIMMFGGLFISIGLLIFFAIAWSAGYLGLWLKRSIKAQIIMNRVAGTVFIVLALRLAVGEI